MDKFYTYVGIIAGLVAIVVGVITILEKKQYIGKKTFFIILSVLGIGIVIISGIFILPLLAFTNTPSANGKGTSPTSTVTPSSSPTQIVSSPTATPSLATTPSPVGPETLNENIRLSCQCSDPVVVTITKIVVDPSQNRMNWTLTFSNNSQETFIDAQFYQFELQKGDQINNPTPGEPPYPATGVGVDPYVHLLSGDTKTETLTFSFVPYQGIPYTLVSVLDIGYGRTIKFDQKVFQF